MGSSVATAVQKTYRGYRARQDTPAFVEVTAFLLLYFVHGFKELNPSCYVVVST